MTPALIITPHSSGYIPYDILVEMLGEAVYDSAARQARLEYLFFEGDPYTDALFYVPGAQHVGALASRFVVDLNRSRNEDGPNGVIKLTDFSGRPLYPAGYSLSAAGVEERLARYYDPFHASLDRALAQDDVLFFVDGHSMSPYGPLIGPDEGEPRPAFCIITGGGPQGEPLPLGEPPSIPAEVAQEIVRLLKRHFADIIADTQDVPDAYWINDPFALGGTHYRLSHASHPSQTPGFALEFNRGLFLRRDASGFEETVPGRVRELNARFQQFIGDLVPVFEALRTY